MKKEIRKQKKCKLCHAVEYTAIYEIYCDNCGALIEKGRSYLRELSYTVWDNSDFNKDIEDRSKEKDFCSYKCLLTRMMEEHINDKDKYIHLDFHIGKKERRKFMEAIKNLKV